MLLLHDLPRTQFHLHVSPFQAYSSDSGLDPVLPLSFDMCPPSYNPSSEGERTRKLGDTKIQTLRHGKSGVFCFFLKAPQQILPIQEAFPSVYSLCHSTHKPVPLDIFFSCTQVPSSSSQRLNTLALRISKRRHLC